jgi:hypothetical protein
MRGLSSIRNKNDLQTLAARHAAKDYRYAWSKFQSNSDKGDQTKEHPISTITEASTKSSSRLARFIITSTLVVASFIVGAAVMAIIAVRVGTTVGTTALVGVVSADLNATTNALNDGDSKTRLTVLTQINQSFDSPTPQPIDPQSAAWILPAIEQCLTKRSYLSVIRG